MAVPFLDGFPYFPNAAGGSLRTCAAGTTTNIDTWTTQAGDVANANPIPLDAAGYPQSGGIWLSPGVAYRFFLYDADGALIREEDNISGAAVGADLATSAGSTALGWIQDGTGAQLRTVSDRLRDRVSVFDYMTSAQIADVKAGTRTLDVGAAINAAFAAAVALTRETVTDPYSVIRLRGVTVYFPAGVYRSDLAPIQKPAGIGMVGDGEFSSVIRSSYNGRIIEEEPTTGVYPSNGTSIADIGIVGDRAQASQVGLALLRPTDSTYRNIYIINCGSDGLLIKQGLCAHFERISSYQNKGAGIRVMDGVNSWSDSTATNFPSNNCTFVQCHPAFNDGPGVKLDGTGTTALGFANANRFINCAIEYNYHSSAEGVGNNVEDFSSSYFGNTFDHCWFESPASGTGALKYHILKTASSISAILYLRNCKHAANGASAYPERYVCVTEGTVLDYESQGTNNLYRTVAGSNAPMRLTKATARIDVTDPVGSLITDGRWVEDETGATTGLVNNARIDVFGALYGPTSHRADSTDVGFEHYRTGDAQPYSRFNANTRSLDMGAGSATPVTALINNRVGISDDRGDAGVTLVAGVDYGTQRFATALTANRTVTLSGTGAVRGHRFRVVRAGLGSFTLDVGGLKTIPSATAAWVDVEHDGTAWRLTGYGTL